MPAFSVFFALISTLFGIAISVQLTTEQFQELAKKDYFIYPNLAADYSVKDHIYGNHWFGSITNILNRVANYGKFEETEITMTFSQDVKDAKTGKMVRERISKQYFVAIFVQRSEHVIKKIKHTARVEYHCYHPEDATEEGSLVDFYRHTKPKEHHTGDTIYEFNGCRACIKWGMAKAEDVWLLSEQVPNLYIRVADPAKRIWYLTNRERGTVEIRNYEFWRRHSDMFHPRTIQQFDHAFVFHPLLVTHGAHVADPCNSQRVKSHPGIILVDDSWHDGGYLKAGCLVNLHLKNLAKQWLGIWKLVEPLQLNDGSSFIGNKVPNDGPETPPTLIESSVEIIKRTNAAPAIKWKQCETRHNYIRECEIKSVGDDCVCATASLGDQCSGLCSKRLYLLPSDHSQAFSARDLSEFVQAKSVQYLVTEYDTDRFEISWNDGDYSDGEAEVWTACKLAVNPENTHIKKLALADLEPYSMYSADSWRYFHLFRPKYNDIYPIWSDYYFDMFVHIRNHALVKTLNGVVSEMNQAEIVAMPIGMLHYDPISVFLLDKLYPVDEDDAEASEEDQIVIARRKEHKKLHTVFSNYFGRGIDDLLQNPQKLKNVYKFAQTQDRRNIWITNHHNGWN